MNKRPLLSLWVGLVLAILPLVESALGIAQFFTNLEGIGIFLVLFSPLGFIQPAVIIAILIGLYLRHRTVLMVYMVIFPIFVFPLSTLLDRIIFREDHIGASLGYGAASSLAITAYLAVLVGSIIFMEYLAVRDLRMLKHEQIAPQLPATPPAP